jgi:L-fucose mutarotase
VPTVAQVFEVILGAVRIDEVNTMGVDRSDSYAGATPGDPAVWAEYRRILAAAQSPCPLTPIVKWDFYEAVASDDHVLTIQTGDKAPWANLLLSIGCRTFTAK